MENVVTRLITQSTEYPERLLVDAPDGALDYASFLRRSLSIAERISGAGLEKGDRVAFWQKITLVR